MTTEDVIEKVNAFVAADKAMSEQLTATQSVIVKAKADMSELAALATGLVKFRQDIKAFLEEFPEQAKEVRVALSVKPLARLIGDLETERTAHFTRRAKEINIHIHLLARMSARLRSSGFPFQAEIDGENVTISADYIIDRLAILAKEMEAVTSAKVAIQEECRRMTLDDFYPPMGSVPRLIETPEQQAEGDALRSRWGTRLKLGKAPGN